MHNATVPVNVLAHELLQIQCILHIEATLASLKEMPHIQFAAICRGKTIHSPIECKHLYGKQLKCLLARLYGTSVQSEGELDFCKDMCQLALNLQDVLCAGIAGTHHVEFHKWSIEQHGFCSF